MFIACTGAHKNNQQNNSKRKSKRMFKTSKKFYSHNTNANKLKMELSKHANAKDINIYYVVKSTSIFTLNTNTSTMEFLLNCVCHFVHP